MNTSVGMSNVRDRPSPYQRGPLRKMTRSETISLLGRAIEIAQNEIREAMTAEQAAIKAGIAAGLLTALDLVIELDSLE